MELLEKYIKNPSGFLVLCGQPGGQKTYIAAAMTGWMIKNFNSFRVYKEAALLRMLRDSMGTTNSDYITVLNHLIDDDMIVLDDVGSQGHSDWREEVFFDFLENRYCDMKPAIITTNHLRADFEKIYHKRVVSRLFAKENTIITVPEIDFREQGF